MLLREPLDGAGKRSPGRHCGDRARSVTWRAFIPASVFRYRGRSRRSQGSLPQQRFRLVSARRSDKGILPIRYLTGQTWSRATCERRDRRRPKIGPAGVAASSPPLLPL